jgi:hypothetical protein
MKDWVKECSKKRAPTKARHFFLREKKGAPLRGKRKSGIALTKIESNTIYS